MHKHQVTWLPCEIEALLLLLLLLLYTAHSWSNLNWGLVSPPTAGHVSKQYRSFAVESSLLALEWHRYYLLQSTTRLTFNIWLDPQIFPQILPAEMQQSVITLLAKYVPLSYRPKILSYEILLERPDKMQSLPFTTQSTRINMQEECPDWRRTLAHLNQDPLRS